MINIIVLSFYSIKIGGICMKKTCVKTAVLIMCLAMTFSLLAGCAKPATDNGSSTGNQTAPAQAVDNTAASSGKISEKERVLKVMFPEHPNQPVKDFAPAQQEIFKKTNIKLQFEVVPSSNYDDKKKILLATNNLPDIIRISKSDVNDYGTSGIFLPLMDYVRNDMVYFKEKWESIPDLIKVTLDGKLYGFPVIARNEAKNGYGPVIRVDLLKKHNLETPDTFDELLDVLAKLKEIYPDSIPWSMRSGTVKNIQKIAYMLGSGYGDDGIYYDYDVDGGRYVFGPATKEFKNVLSYLNKAYKMGVLDPDYAVSTKQQWEENLTSGKSFFFLDNSGFGLNYTNNLRKTDPEATFQIIPIPANQDGVRRAVFYATVFTGEMYAINAKIKDPDTVIKFIDWMYSEEGSNITNFGVEGETFYIDENGEPQFIADYVNKFKDAQPSPYYAVYSDLGITKLNFSLWACNTMTQFQIEKLTGTWSDLYDEYWTIVGNDKAYVEPVMDPPLTAEEAERVKDILASLNTMLEQEYDKFIIGVKDISEYDAVIDKAIEMGALELEQIYNDALARLQQ